MVDAITAGQFAWPPKGIIPFDWMVPRFFSDVAAAWQVFERILDPNRTSLRPCGNGSEGLWWAVCHDEEMVAHAKNSPEQEQKKEA